MKTKLRLPLLLLTLLSLPGFAHGQGTAISYQGRLNHAGAPATGLHDFTFNVYDVEAGGTALATTVVLTNVPVTNGLFNVSLDFGPATFSGPARWLEIGVRTNGSVAAYSILSPRQALTPSPYAIFATTSGTASNVVNGSVVKSLNGLKDSVTLAAGSNVTITPSGNTLTIASTGGGGGSNGIWSLNGASAYYNGGNVGIGTLAPESKLEIQGTVGAIRFDPDLITIGSNNDGYELSLVGGVPDGSSAGGQIRLGGSNRGDADLNVIQFKQNDTEVMRINNAGNVGIGTASPAVKLDVHGTGPTEATVWSVNEKAILSLNSTLGGQNRIWTLESGVFGTPGLFGIYDRTAGRAGLTIDTAGNVGIGTTTPVAKLHAETSAADTAAIYGYATGPGGVGVYAQGPSGTAIFADGNARQRFDRGGFVKAMVYVRDSAIVSCFNGINNASSDGCGIVLTTPLGKFAGVYRINFGVPVSGRFFSVTAEYRGHGDFSNENNRGANYRHFDETSVEVFTFASNNTTDTRWADFMLIMY